MHRVELAGVACGLLAVAVSLTLYRPEAPRFVVTPAGRGIYRTDTKTGEVYLYTPAGYRKIEDRLPTE